MTKAGSALETATGAVSPEVLRGAPEARPQARATAVRGSALQPGACGPAPPLVFTVKQRGAFRLHALDKAALAAGLEPGMALADARARIPSLCAVPHDAAGEARLMERLADLAERFTPMVAIAPPDGLVLDITGCAHLFGSEAALAGEALRLMRGRGLEVRGARAATPEAALALAQFGPPRGDGPAQEAAAIRRLPLLALRPAPDALLALRRAGFATIGDLADQSAKPLAARFGASLVAMRDRLLARVDSRITPRRPLPPVGAERRFAEPVARVETVRAVLGDLLAEVSAELAARRQGGRRFAARLYRSDGAQRDLAVETGQPVRDPALVLRLFAERIETLADPIDPGFGFDIIRLAVPRVEDLEEVQPALDGARTGAADLNALLDRLGVRVGAHRFRRLAPRDSHMPERVTRLVPATGASSASPAWEMPVPDEPPLRPLLLLDPPEPLEVLAAVPDGPPRRFRWRGQAHRVVAQEGPERIAPEWWRRMDGHAGNPGLTRDYYRVEDADGRRFWLFRHGLYERETTQPHWYLHGLFA